VQGFVISITPTKFDTSVVDGELGTPLLAEE
jgi:hypothetical protein